MDNQLEYRRAWVPWAAMSLMLVVVAVIAYSIGARHDLVEAGADGTRVVYRHGPWFGFGFLWIFVVFWFFGAMRWLFWGRPYGPWGYRGYGRWYGERRDEWEDWHRRAHERMHDAESHKGTPPADQGRG